ncbi:MAG TPA: copper resistance system multicopper oxidase [Gammaproteobacteria bacterium]
MPLKRYLLLDVPNRSKRRFVQGLAAAGAAGMGLNPLSLWAGNLPAAAHPAVLRGNRFDLSIGEAAVNFTGRQRTATVINGTLPAPVLRWREGERVTLRVTNRLPHDSSIHWHGIILPFQMDGVPGLSFDGIRPGETFTYSFDVNQSGTYWYHSHSGFQEQTGLHGAIVIDPREPDPVAYDRDYVVMLTEWTDEDPEDIYGRLKKESHYYNINERTTGDLWRDIREKGAAQTFRERSMWNRMRMSDRDLSDVTGYTYTFLMNGRTPADGWTGLFRRGERVRLRFINGATMTFFEVRIPGLKMTVVAADGQNVEPVSVDEFRIGVAETYDVIVEPKGDTAYTLFAQAIDRSGYARGTLTPDPALGAEIPAMDPVPLLTHTDMGMGMNHAAHGSLSKNENHDEHVNHEDAMEHKDHDMPGMDHGGHGMMVKQASGKVSGKAGYGSSREIRHAKTEFGPHVDMRAETPVYRLDDPGAGLRNNGRRVLTYADLKNLNTTPDPREPEREIDLHLTGNMGRYMWSFNGVKHADAAPIFLRHNERIRINLVNDTMMNHPIHLHGMWSDLETGDPQHIPRKHTVVVQPGARVSYLVTADALGPWAYHCHLLYHMPGMFRTVIVK